LQITASARTNLWLGGTAGLQYIIQSSPNLVQWTPYSTNTLVTNSMVVPLSLPPTDARFFRAIRQP
jgi:hypothetical protein